MSLHAVLDRMGKVRQAALADIAVTDEVVDSNAEEVAGRVGEDAREADVCA
jgi:hypothetical protein